MCLHVDEAYLRGGHAQQMSDALGGKVWIENFVLSCARKYGSKFAKPTEQKGYRVQLIEVSGTVHPPANRCYTGLHYARVLLPVPNAKDT